MKVTGYGLTNSATDFEASGVDEIEMRDDYICLVYSQSGNVPDSLREIADEVEERATGNILISFDGNYRANIEEE